MNRTIKIIVNIASSLFVLSLFVFIFVLVKYPQVRNNIFNGYYHKKLKHYVRLSFDPNYTEELKISKTKFKLSDLKSGLLAFLGDTGRFPYTGSNKNKKSAYNQELLLNIYDSNKNVLVSSNTEYIEIPYYERKWKGPYMEGHPSDFMIDEWGMPIIYIAENKNLFLWSYGPNKKPDRTNVEESFKEQQDKNVDDIVISVMRNKYKFED